VTAGRAATVLYENGRTRTRGFKLHDLVVAHVADQTGLERRDLARRLDGRAMKGVGGLMRACSEEANRIAADGRAVVALFDRDRLHRHVDLARDATDEAVESALRARGALPCVEIHLLYQNTESILEAAVRCGLDVPRETREKAIRHKKPLYRDLVLQQAARAANRSIRECVRREVPSFDQFLRRLCSLVAEQGPATSP